jgi:hypothetical protein
MVTATCETVSSGQRVQVVKGVMTGVAGTLLARPNGRTALLRLNNGVYVRLPEACLKTTGKQ